MATDDTIAALKLIPGLRVRGSVARQTPLTIEGYENSYGLGADLASRLGGTMDWVQPPAPHVPWRVVREVLEARSEADMGWLNQAYPWQQEGLGRSALRGSYHFWWPTGSGKTLGAIWWLLLADGPGLIGCPARVRMQWAKALRVFTNLVPYAYDPGAREKKGRQLPHPLELGEWGPFNETWVRLWEPVTAVPAATVTSQEGEWDVTLYSPRGTLIASKAKKDQTPWPTPEAAMERADTRLKQYRGRVAKTRGEFDPERYRSQPKPSLERYLAYCAEKKTRPVVICALESLPQHVEEITSVLKPTSVVYDEIHRLKGWTRDDWIPLPQPRNESEAQTQMAEATARNGEIVTFRDGSRSMKIPRTGRVNAALALSRSVSRRLGCTATPISDRVRDLWGQLDICQPVPPVRFAVGPWGSFKRFTARYAEGKPGIYGGWDSTGFSHGDELYLRLATEAHSVSYETTTAHLPAKRRVSYYVPPDELTEPTPGFARLFAEAKRRGPGAVLWAQLAEMASRKRKVVVSVAEDYLLDGTGKRKVAIFTGTHEDVERLAQEASKRVGKAAEVRWAHGDIPADRRHALVEWYAKHPGGCCLVSTWDAMGEGIDGLQCTDAFLAAMLPWNPGKLHQGEGRFHGRGGQDRPVTVYYFVGQTPGAAISIDEHLASVLIDKLDAVEEVVADAELAGAKTALAGSDGVSDEEFAVAILQKLASTAGDALIDREDAFV